MFLRYNKNVVKTKISIPKEVQNVLKELSKAGYEAYIVGGCVRDLVRGKKPKDWDVATNAEPDEIQKVFPKSFYTNKFGTVTVQFEGEIREVEVTTYRIDEKYTDKRHPDSVTFTKDVLPIMQENCLVCHRPG